MCRRSCIYRSGSEICLYSAIEGKTKMAQVCKELGLPPTHKDVRERMQWENCTFFVWDKKGDIDAGLKKSDPDSKKESWRKQDGPKWKLKEEEIRDLYRKGMNDTDIGEIVGLDRKVIRQWRIGHDLPNNVRNDMIQQKRNEEIMELYTKGLSDKEIAQKIGVTPGYIWKWRTDRGLKLKAKKSLDRTLFEKLYREGKTDVEISRELGCSSETIRNWRKKEGLELNRKQDDRNSLKKDE